MGQMEKEQTYWGISELQKKLHEIRRDSVRLFK